MFKLMKAKCQKLAPFHFDMPPGRKAEVTMLSPLQSHLKFSHRWVEKLRLHLMRRSLKSLLYLLKPAVKLLYLSSVSRTVVFTSEGLVASSKSSYLGRYYFTMVDETGRVVYQHEHGTSFLHYIDDPIHRCACSHN